MASIALTDHARSKPAQASRARVRRRALLAAAGLAILLVVGLCWVFRRPWFQGNLGVVDVGRVIRSAQPTSQLPGWIRDYGIRSILNLRGGGPDDWWYEAEVKAAEASGVSFYDFPLNATRRPTRHEILVLIDTLQSCPYPLLIHCKSGADRTGLASAIYLMIRCGLPPDQAEGAFTLDHGHVPIGGPEHLHEPLNEYGTWLAAHGLSHSPDRFRDWIKNDYRSAGSRDDPAPLKPGPRPRHTSPLAAEPVPLTDRADIARGPGGTR